MSLAAHPDRWVPLEGTVNFRDLGGYPTLDGRSTRWRSTYRADGLHALTDADIHELKARGLGTVIDLRTSGEIEVATMQADFADRWINIPLLLEVAKPDEFAKTPGLLGSHYLEMIDEGQDRIKAIFEAILDSGPAAVVYHCSAGKDRTGIVSGLLLSHVGVDRETVIADYALSALAMDALRERLMARYPEAADSIAAANSMFEANPLTLEKTLAKVDADYGGATQYLHSCGLSPEQLQAITERTLI